MIIRGEILSLLILVFIYLFLSSNFINMGFISVVLKSIIFLIGLTTKSIYDLILKEFQEKRYVSSMAKAIMNEIIYCINDCYKKNPIKKWDGKYITQLNEPYLIKVNKLMILEGYIKDINRLKDEDIAYNISKFYNLFNTYIENRKELIDIKQKWIDFYFSKVVSSDQTNKEDNKKKGPIEFLNEEIKRNEKWTMDFKNLTEVTYFIQEELFETGDNLIKQLENVQNKKFFSIIKDRFNKFISKFIYNI